MKSLGDASARKDEGGKGKGATPAINTSPARARNKRVAAPPPGAHLNLAGLKHARSFSFKCSVPPTANHMHTVARGRKIKSGEYRAWVEAAIWEVAAEHKWAWPLFKTPVAVALTFPKKHALSDLDNRIKPTLDLLQGLKLVANDNLVHEISAKWRPKSYADQDRAWVTVTELS